MKTKLNIIIKVIGIVVFVAVVFGKYVFACEITMGYRTNERLPLIAEAPDNNGLYFKLYKDAIASIGCKLKIIRQPKKRILSMLAQGAIDFYPGLSFTEKRAKTFFYIENGLPGGEIGISLAGLSDVTDLNQLKGKKVIKALGGPDYLQGTKGIKVHPVAELSIEGAIKMLIRNRGDFYIYNKSTLDYYLAHNPMDEIKKHPDCCGGLKPMYLGFSRNSKNFEEIPNPDFNPDQSVSIKNYPTKLKTGCVADKLAKSILFLKKQGKVQSYYEKYYGIN